MILLGPDGRFNIGAAATRLLVAVNAEAILIQFDPDNGQLALCVVPRGTEDSYSITYANGKSQCAFSSRAFVRYIGWGYQKNLNLPVEWDAAEKRFLTTLPLEHTGIPKPTRQGENRRAKKAAPQSSLGLEQAPESDSN